jgi:chromosome segregation ATPase
MIDQNQLPKELEEQIQGVASEVYIQIEDKLTHLIRAAIDAGANKETSLDQNENIKSLNESYQESQTKLAKLEQNRIDEQQSSAAEISELKAKLEEIHTNIAAKEQSFQVELTQNTINYTETIDQLKLSLANTQNDQATKQSKELKKDSQLQGKLVAHEQELKDKTQEIDSLKSRVSELIEQEKNLLTKVSTLTAQDKDNNLALQAELTSVEQKNNELAESLSNQEKKINDLTQQLGLATDNLRKVSEESELALDKTVKEEQKKIADIEQQLQQEQHNKIDLQQELTEQQKTIDTQLDMYTNLEQDYQTSQEQVTQLQEKIVIEQENVVKEQENIKLAEELAAVKIKDIKAEQKVIDNKVLDDKKQQETTLAELTQLQVISTQKILDLEKNNTELFEQLMAEKDIVQLQQLEVSALKEKIKEVEQEQESILQRFNSSREKQEKDNDKVRETIKFLRDENHSLLSGQTEEAASLSQTVNELEHKLTEYRLKFEYAQKQLTT